MGRAVLASMGCVFTFSSMVDSCVPCFSPSSWKHSAVVSFHRILGIFQGGHRSSVVGGHGYCAVGGHGSCAVGRNIDLAQGVTMDLAHPAGSCQKWVNMDLAQWGEGLGGGHCANFK